MLTRNFTTLGWLSDCRTIFTVKCNGKKKKKKTK